MAGSGHGRRDSVSSEIQLKLHSSSQMLVKRLSSQPAKTAKIVAPASDESIEVGNNATASGMLEMSNFRSRETVLSEEISLKSDASQEDEDANKEETIAGPSALLLPATSLQIRPLDIKWIFGVDNLLPLINLTTLIRTEIVYCSNNIIVIYDYQSYDMSFFQTHQNRISSISAEQKGYFMASGDTGPNHCLIVWDIRNRTPIYTAFEPYPESGILCLGLSNSGKYLITLGQATEYIVSFYIWTEGKDKEDHAIRIRAAVGQPKKICFNPSKEEHIMIVFERALAFIYWDMDERKMTDVSFAPIVNRTKYGSPIDGTYVPFCHQCYIATTGGYVLKCGDTLYTKSYEEGEYNNRKKIVNAIRITSASLTCILSADEYIVTGDSEGCMRFYDNRIRILYWQCDFKLTSIKYISMHLFKPAYEPDPKLESNTWTGLCYLLVAYQDGTLVLHDYDICQLIVTSKLPAPLSPGEDNEEAVVTCVKYCNESIHLVCGRSNGEIWVLEPILLTPRQEVFKVTSAAIIKIAFSSDSLQFACIDKSRATSLFLYDKEEGLWSFAGKVKAHYKDIIDVMFYPIHPSKLLTLGADRHLCQYNNISVATKREEFVAIRKDRLEQRSIPYGMIYYPLYDETNKNGFIMTADNEHKYKCYVDTTLIPRSTALGPAYGCYDKTPVTKMIVVPESDGEYLLYKTKRHIGLQLLPPDGNPFRYVGVNAHPEELKDMVISWDGNFAFSFGVNDRTIVMWVLKKDSVKKLEAMGGHELEPFYCLLEGGKTGWLFQEMQDLFYYMQILASGENTVAVRKVCDTIGITELPELVRACGFYPTDYEIENMLMDIKHRDYIETNTLRENLTFFEFVRLFVNHRPCYGYSLESLENAFESFCYSVRDPSFGSVSKESFIEAMTECGERFNDANLHKCLAILMREDRTHEADFGFLPEDIYFDLFADDMLGIDMDRRDVERDETSAETDSTQSDVYVLGDSV